MDALNEVVEPVRRLVNENEAAEEDEGFLRINVRGRFSGEAVAGGTVDPPKPVLLLEGGLVLGFKVVTGVIVGELIMDIGFGRLLFLGYDNTGDSALLDEANVCSCSSLLVVGAGGGDEEDCSPLSFEEEGLRRSLGSDNWEVVWGGKWWGGRCCWSRYAIVEYWYCWDLWELG